MGYIRGSSRSLPPDCLRQGRAKLARLLGRIRCHTTNVVELIEEWRRRPKTEGDGSPPPLRAAPGASADAGVTTTLPGAAAANAERLATPPDAFSASASAVSSAASPAPSVPPPRPGGIAHLARRVQVSAAQSRRPRPPPRPRPRRRGRVASHTSRGASR